MATDHTTISVTSKGSRDDSNFGYAFIVSGSGSTANFEGGTVSIYGKQTDYSSQALTIIGNAEITFNNSGDVILTSESPYSATVVATDAQDGSSLCFNNKGNVTLIGRILPGDETAKANVVGLQGINSNWKVTDQVNRFSIELHGAGVDAEGTGYSSGTKAIFAQGDTTIDINSKSFEILMDVPTDTVDTTTDEHTAEEAYAVYLYGGTQLTVGQNTKTIITVDEGLGTAYGIYAVGATATINGDAEIKALGNPDYDSVAVMLYAAEVTFNGKDNSLTGDIWSLTGNDDGEDKSSLIFKNGTTKIDGNVFTDGGSTITLENAAIDLAAGNTLESEGTFKSSNSEIVVNEVSTTPIVSVASLSGDLTVAASGALNDTFASPEEAAAALQKSVSIKTAEDSDSYELTGKSGSISDSWTANAKGEVTQRTENASLNAFKNFNAMTLIAWRSENNHLTQRLGDIRDNAGAVGGWARVYGYDSKHSDVASIKYKSNAIQAGADFRFADDYVAGVAFSYTNGEGTLSNGSADAESYTLAAYLSGFFPCGGYFDLIGRAGRLSTDISAANQMNVMKASYDNTTLGLSAEFGWHYEMNPMFYVEPQAELSYAVALGDDFTASNGVKVSQDDYQSLVGRLGARLGANFADKKGTVYLSASVNHDFLGDADSTVRLGHVSKAVSVDAGGTWVSYGVGAQFNTTKNLSFYGSLEKANGNDYRENYRYNVGLRYVW